MELALDLTKQYTYADYLTWMDDKSRELINGFIYMMCPAPRFEHANVHSNIFGCLKIIVQKNKGKCKIISAPFDVRFPKNGEIADDKIYTVVQPDISIICDLSKIDSNGCCGAPDMVVEILSPSTFKRDMREKYDLYEEHGVKEYWIVDPKYKTVNVYLLQEDGKYNNGILYESEKKIPIHIFDNYFVNMDDIFDM